MRGQRAVRAVATDDQRQRDEEPSHADPRYRTEADRALSPSTSSVPLVAHCDSPVPVGKTVPYSDSKSRIAGRDSATMPPTRADRARTIDGLMSLSGAGGAGQHTRARHRRFCEARIGSRSAQ